MSQAQVKIKPFKGYVNLYYYDPGDDMDHNEIWYVEISRDGVIKKILTPEEREKIDMFRMEEDRKKLNEIFDMVDKMFLEPIRNKKCPICGRSMKVVKMYRKRKLGAGRYLRHIYPDLKPYDEEKGYWYTCFKCGIKYYKWYENVDGGAVLYWKYEIEKDGKRATCAKYGITNDRTLFDAYTEFIDGLIKMGLLQIEE